MPFPADSVQIALGAGEASLQASGIETKDFHDTVNDLLHGPSIPVVASFDVQWSGKTRQFQLPDAANGFRGEFVETSATLEWSSSEAGLDFVSDPAETSHTELAVLGQEHNGVFF